MTLRLLRSVAILLLVPFLARCMPLTGHATRALQTSEPAAESLLIAASFADVAVTYRPGSTIDVDARIELRTEGGNQVAEREIERIAVLTTREGNRLIVSQGLPGEAWNDRGRSSGSGSIALAVPPGTPIEIRTASGDVRLSGDGGAAAAAIRSASGDVRVDDGNFPRLSVTTASGDATLRLSGPMEEFVASTASGDLRMDSFAGPRGPLAIRRSRVRAASGDVRLRGLAGSADVATASGDVRVEVISLPTGERIAISTASGEAVVDLASGIEPTGRVTTASGDLAIAMPVELSRRSATLLGGGGTLEVSTASGSIRIQHVGR